MWKCVPVTWFAIQIADATIFACPLEDALVIYPDSPLYCPDFLREAGKNCHF